MDNSWQAPVCFYFQQGNCRFGQDCHYRHTQETGVSLDSICWYYQENGWCPHGRSCKFMHNPNLTYYPMPPINKRSTDQSVCIFFQRGSCKRGNNCSFLHPGEAVDLPMASGHITSKSLATQQRNDNSETVHAEALVKELQEMGTSEQRLETSETVDNKRRNRRRKPKAKQTTNAQETKNSTSDSVEAAGAPIASSPLSVQDETKKLEKKQVAEKDATSVEEVKKTCSLTQEQCLAIQERERKMLKQRMSADNLVVKTNSKGEEYYEFEYSATDPDWRYDFKSVPLRVSFPEDYPKSPMKVKCLSSDVLPDSITSTCNKAISKWLEQRMDNIGRSSETGDLAFRPFLRWLDRRLEGIFTEGLKEYKRAMVLRASGISIWTPDKLRRALGHDSDEEEEQKEESVERHQESLTEAPEGSEIDKTGDAAQEQKLPAAAGLDVRPSGVELRLRDLQLGEDTASVLFSRVRLVLQCERCRHPQDLPMTSNQPLTLSCERCSNDLMACFRPALVHAFSPVIGYFDGIGCRPADAAFLEWKFTVTCLSCNRAIDRVNIRPGELKSFKCVDCFKEQRFAFNSVHFTRLADDAQIFDSAKIQRIVSLKPKKVPKDPAIREGFPLPHEGTCKHYKKSHRWLRFPCCGRAFPCDVCHDEAITDGHEMSFASRMICGFCCKEQAYSADRPCVACHKSMTRARSSHWEGGKGCRDKTAMSRNDTKKYANSNKTVSKRSQKT